jgi:hypothetical protein
MSGIFHMILSGGGTTSPSTIEYIVVAGGGAGGPQTGGRGGGGCVIVGYPTSSGKILSGGTEYVSGAYYIHQYTSVGGGQSLTQV